MWKNILKQSGTIGKLLELSFASFILLIFTLAVWNILGLDANSITVIKQLQTLHTIVVFALPPLLLGYFWYNSPIKAYALHRRPQAVQIVKVVVLMIVISPFISYLAYLNEQIILPHSLIGLEEVFKEMEHSSKVLIDRMLFTTTLSGLLGNILVIAILPAISEEIFFRGAVQKILNERIPIIFAIYITAIIFSAIHFQFYGFFPRILLGVLFGYLLLWGESLWLPIIAHFVNNTIGILLPFFIEKETLTEYQKIGIETHLWLPALSFILSILLIFWIRYTSKHRKKENIRD